MASATQVAMTINSAQWTINSAQCCVIRLAPLGSFSSASRTSVGFYGLRHSSHSLLLHSTPRKKPFMHLPAISAASVEIEDVDVEPTTNVKFARSYMPPGGSEMLSLIGTGFREKSIAFLHVKVYALGVYVSTAILANLSKWKGKKADALVKDAAFFKAVAEAPVEKSIKIVLVRDVDGETFWKALDDALKPRLKAANAGIEGQEALDAFGEVFYGRSLKQGTSIILTWTQPFKLQVAVSGVSMVAQTVEASIVSAVLVSALFDVFLGDNAVSPSAKASIATTLAALL